MLAIDKEEDYISKRTVNQATDRKSVILSMGKTTIDRDLGLDRANSILY
jgi:hypothetical protein